MKQNVDSAGNFGGSFRSISRGGDTHHVMGTLVRYVETWVKLRVAFFFHNELALSDLYSNYRTLWRPVSDRVSIGIYRLGWGVGVDETQAANQDTAEAIRAGYE